MLVLRRRLGVVGSTAVGPESAGPSHLAASVGGWCVIAADGARFRGCSGCSECRMLVESRMLLFQGHVPLIRRVLSQSRVFFIRWMLLPQSRTPPIWQVLVVLLQLLLVMLLILLQLLPMVLHSLLRGSIVERETLLLLGLVLLLLLLLLLL